MGQKASCGFDKCSKGGTWECETEFVVHMYPNIIMIIDWLHTPDICPPQFETKSHLSMYALFTTVDDQLWSLN
jgi:hypothetical protein